MNITLQTLCSRGEAVAAHDFGEGYGVGWAAGCGFGDDGDFADRSARDAERLAGADFDFAAFEREGDDAFDAVDGRGLGEKGFQWQEVWIGRAEAAALRSWK